MKEKISEYLILSWKSLLIIFGAEILAIILHNLISTMVGFEEALFFILSIIVIPLCLIISLIYTVIIKILQLVKSNKKL